MPRRIGLCGVDDLVFVASIGMVDIIFVAICCCYDRDVHGEILEVSEAWSREQGCGRLHDDVVLLFCYHGVDEEVVFVLLMLC